MFSNKKSVEAELLVFRINFVDIKDNRHTRIVFSFLYAESFCTSQRVCTVLDLHGLEKRYP